MSLFTFNFHVHPAGPDAEQVLKRLLERIQNMPTVAEVKAAVAAAAGEEAGEIATRIKELEDRIANGSLTDADRDELVAMVRGIFTPA